MTYTRGSEYKLTSEWFNIRRRQKEHNKVSYEKKKYLEFCKTFGLKKSIKIFAREK